MRAVRALVAAVCERLRVTLWESVRSRWPSRARACCVLSGVVVRRPLRHLLPLLVALVAGSALIGCGSEPEAPGPAKAEQSASSARGLPGLREQANQLLDGGPKGFRERLAELRGHPVVVNQWASWCDPCRAEFPYFKRQAAKHAGDIAFLGVNSQDNRDNAAAFLKELPVPFPHYFDPDGSIARVFRGGRAFPTTAIYSSKGKLAYTHLGAYPSEAKLAEEIRRYANDG